VEHVAVALLAASGGLSGWCLLSFVLFFVSFSSFVFFVFFGSSSLRFAVSVSRRRGAMSYRRRSPKYLCATDSRPFGAS